MGPSGDSGLPLVDGRSSGGGPPEALLKFTVSTTSELFIAVARI
jgi:hypothetical protein